MSSSLAYLRDFWSAPIMHQLRWFSWHSGLWFVVQGQYFIPHQYFSYFYFYSVLIHFTQCMINNAVHHDARPKIMQLRRDDYIQNRLKFFSRLLLRFCHAFHQYYAQVSKLIHGLVMSSTLTYFCSLICWYCLASFAIQLVRLFVVKLELNCRSYLYPQWSAPTRSSFHPFHCVSSDFQHSFSTLSLCASSCNIFALSTLFLSRLLLPFLVLSLVPCPVLV